MNARRIGILGGSFDPPQIGHLILAEYSRESLNMDHILFVPVADHPIKKGEIRLPVHHRLAMLELAIADNPCFSISRDDIDRDGPHYSADTVKIIREQFPLSQLYFVMGGDNLRSLPTWERARELYQDCRLAVMKRADEDIAAEMHDDILPGLSKKLISSMCRCSVSGCLPPTSCGACARGSACATSCPTRYWITSLPIIYTGEPT